jgi:DNA-binding transcriptional MerR regulator
VADYYTLRQLALKVGISEVQIAELEVKGLLHPKLKNGRRFFSSSQAHALKVALRLGRNQGVSLEQAFARVEEMRVCQASTIRN